jgi:DNA-binding NtrC family response regulator
MSIFTGPRHFCLKPGAFDLVITGQTLPGMTGMELAQKLLNVRPDIPVILCTASSNISEEDAKKQGIREFMMKPFETNNLVRTIRKVLDEKVLRQVD